jgi:ribosomal protein S18 acetylase RimI-like enzyme
VVVPPGVAPDRPPGPTGVRLVDLEGAERDRGIPVIRDGFVGIYRWHAKRTLREVPIVRAAERDGEVIGLSLLDLLVPEVGYVYYVAVLSAHRGRGLGALLLDDALDRFRSRNVEVVYAAVREENLASRRLFERREFRPVARKETGWKDGGLGAWGLRSRMRIVPGEILLGRRLRPPSGPPPAGSAPIPSNAAHPDNG